MLKVYPAKACQRRTPCKVPRYLVDVIPDRYEAPVCKELTSLRLGGYARQETKYPTDLVLGEVCADAGGKKRKKWQSTGCGKVPLRRVLIYSFKKLWVKFKKTSSCDFHVSPSLASQVEQWETFRLGLWLRYCHAAWDNSEPKYHHSNCQENSPKDCN